MNGSPRTSRPDAQIAAYRWRIERKSDGDSWFAETSTTENEEHARLWLAERRENHPGSKFRLIRRPVVPWEVVDA